jgi:homoserine kinase
MSAAPTRTARVSVPATSSNLGGGFDCVGVAVDLELRAHVVAEDDGSREPEVRVRREGTLAPLTTPPHEDLVYVGFAATCRARGRAVPRRLGFTLASDIPVARGLGSSSAAIVAGAALADVALGLGCTRDELANICARIEGHPDNVAPAVFGGAVLGVAAGQGAGGTHYAFAPLAVHADVAFAFAVPDFPITTSAARAVLPPMVEHRHAVAAAAKSAALVQGLASCDRALLGYALDDVLHVPFRRALVTGYGEVTAAAVEAGAYGATLSGSGSTLVALSPQDCVEEVAAAMAGAWSRCGLETRAFVQRRPAEARLRRTDQRRASGQAGRAGGRDRRE